ncbi:hypothetical protein [Salinisphaera sp. Q1T1-3]|uniref:DUF6985 domain-containing protein n=1 Tax=Salinisphaera sp. Q1T1-3 TaxID=2321229 RepID=UPI000E721D82|nr:hypothetical protein [Salinisphaera sp. Q1T1-3]RJS94859.1 hypothetical protein D3260_03610 [Salinisphaera sp. Q1T1-3]
MTLIREIEHGEDGLEGIVRFSLFNTDIPALLENEDMVHAERCAAHLNEMSTDIVAELCRASIRYCNAFQDATGTPMQSFTPAPAVLECIQPTLLIIPAPAHDVPIVHLELECDWEAEHGMAWVIRGDHVVYVGPFNGEDPWTTGDDHDAWNFARGQSGPV